MKHYLCILLSICSIYTIAQPNVAVDKFTSISGFENASIGICVKDLLGNDVVSYNKNISLVPASTMKIITTATAIELLGQDYQFKTTLSFDKENPQHIVVRGYGDPTLGSEYMNDRPNSFLEIWLDKIKDVINIQSSVEIEIDDSYFGYQGVSSKWLHEDLGNYYAAGAYGISVYDNSYKLYLNTMKIDNYPEILRTEPEMRDIIFFNTMGTNTTGKDNGYINGEPFSNNRILVGNIPAKRKSFFIKGDIPNPGLYLGQTLAAEMISRNILVKSISTTRLHFYKANFGLDKLLPSNEQEFYTQYSAPLGDIIRVVNEKSNNHYAEHLIRAVSKSRGNIEIPFFNSLNDGIDKTKNFWKSKGINTSGLLMYDGCGLAPSNKVSPAVLCDILLYMYTQSQYSNVFFNSLPKAGREGTVKNLLKGTRLEGKLSVKSGSIADVQCFTGYYIDGNKKYVFSVMVNNYICPRKDVVRNIESLLLSVLL